MHYSAESAICPCLEPYESGQPPPPISLRLILISASRLGLGLPSGLFSSVSPPKSHPFHSIFTPWSRLSVELKLIPLHCVAPHIGGRSPELLLLTVCCYFKVCKWNLPTTKEHIPYELHTSNYHAHHQRPVFYSDANFVLLPLPPPPTCNVHIYQRNDLWADTLTM